GGCGRGRRRRGRRGRRGVGRRRLRGGLVVEDLVHDRAEDTHRARLLAAGDGQLPGGVGVSDNPSPLWGGWLAPPARAWWGHRRFLKRAADGSHHGIQILPDFTIQEAQNPKALAPEHAIA